MIIAQSSTYNNVKNKNLYSQKPLKFKGFKHLFYFTMFYYFNSSRPTTVSPSLISATILDISALPVFSRV